MALVNQARLERMGGKFGTSYEKVTCSRPFQVPDGFGIKRPLYPRLRS